MSYHALVVVFTLCLIGTPASATKPVDVSGCCNNECCQELAPTPDACDTLTFEFGARRDIAAGARFTASVSDVVEDQFGGVMVLDVWGEHQEATCAIGFLRDGDEPGAQVLFNDDDIDMCMEQLGVVNYDYDYVAASLRQAYWGDACGQLSNGKPDVDDIDH